MLEPETERGIWLQTEKAWCVGKVAQYNIFIHVYLYIYVYIYIQ
jgi:hypothetical protein